jgi:hypothetical protein
MAASTYLAQVQQLYIAYFGRPADPIGQAYWAGIIDAAGGSIAAVQAGFSASTESQALYGNKSTIDKVTAIYQNVFNRAPDAAGLAFWVAQIDSGKVTQAQASWTIQQNAGPGDAATVQNKLTAAQAFTAQIDTTAEISGYQGTAAAASGRTFLGTVTSDNATATAAVAGAAAAVVAATAVGSVGTTFVLTTGVDNLLGDGGNNIFIGDNSGAATSNTVSAADQINGGAGTDTFKYFVAAGQAIDTLQLPQLTSVENLYIKSGTLTNAASADFSAVAGLTNIELDTPATLAAASTFTIKTSAAQSVRLDGVNTIAAGTGTIALSAATAVALSGVGTDATATGTVVVDLTSATATAATISAVGAASKVTLNNTGAKVATLNITGDQNLTLTESLGTLKTINASTATGKVSVNATGATLDVAFAFTGGTGADTLSVTEASLATLTSGAQLNGGAGIDTLNVTGTNLVLSTADYKVLNATTGFEVLGLGGTTTNSVDASLLTSFKEFAVAGGTNVISKVATGTTIDLLGATTKTTVGGAVGVSDLTINIGSTTATTGTANTALDVTGLTNVTINSNIKAGTTGQTNAIGTLTNSDNSTFTIKGNGDTSLALATATNTGSKIDGSASTGNLTLTGNQAAYTPAKPSLGDVLIGGSGNDTINTGFNTSTLTGGAGKDKFVINAVAGSDNAAKSIITDFAKGDSIQFATATTATAITKVDLSTQAAGLTDVQVAALLATGGANTVTWGVYNGNTYVVEDNTAGVLAGTDIVVKLTGALDLSTSTVAANTVTFA